MRVFLIAASLGAAVTLAAVPAEAQRYANNWRTVGYKTVDGRDSDTINLPGYARHRQVKLCAFNAPIHVRDFDVRFENGRNQDVRVRQVIRPGTCTRNIDLAGARRDIRSIRLRYEPIFRGRRPLVRVQAR